MNNYRGNIQKGNRSLQIGGRQNLANLVFISYLYPYEH